MIRRARFRSLAAAGCAALLLAGCGGTGTGTQTGPGGDPVAGGTARILQVTEPRTLDPVAMGNSWVINSVLGNALYGTLMVNDPDSGDIEFKMAEKFTTSDGGATFELTLRPDLKFSDGSPLDAAAVKYNWDRFKDPANGSSYLDDGAMVASTEVVDQRTLRVTMGSPTPHFAFAIVESSMNWIAAPAALAAGRGEFDKQPVGAGPFTLERWARQDVIELVKNPTYWDAPKPYLDRILLRTSGDATQRLNALTSGGAEAIIHSNWGHHAQLAGQGFPAQVSPLHGGNTLTMNTRRAPFNDVRARRAVSAALDLDTFNATIYNGQGELPTTLFRETSPYHDASLTLHTPDKEAAQRLFNELAAEGKPVSFTYTASPSTENRITAESVQAQLSAFDNVEVKVNVIDTVDLLRVHMTHDFDMMTSSASFDDPEPRLWTAFHGASSSRNLSGIDDRELNAALDAGRTATNQAERDAAYHTVQERLIALTPVIFFTRTFAGAATGRNVGGLHMYTAGSVLPEELWIAE